MEEWDKKDAQFLADICAFEEPQALLAKPVPQVQCLRLTPAEYQRAHEVGCACTFSQAFFIFYIHDLCRCFTNVVARF